MNYNSQICRFISENENWQELIEEKLIKFNTEGPLAIFNYRDECDFGDPIVQEARGIIINLEALEVVCWPFRKFGNWNESYADPIDWNTARVQEKVDGSIVKLWFDKLRDEWRFSTNSTIDAAGANADSLTGESYLDLIKKTDNYKDIPFDGLDKDNTYIFELVSPQNRVVIDYPYYRLFHIGTRTNISGRERLVDIGIVKPAEYPLHSLKECVEAAKILNRGNEEYDESTTPSLVEKEGFVVVDIHFNRIKVKSPDYLVIHHTIKNGNFSKERVLKLLREEEINVDDFCREYPEYAVYIRYYQYRLAELEFEATAFIRSVLNMYEEYSHERKAVALMIKDHKYAGLGFMALDTGKSAAELITELEMSKLLKLIPDYVPAKIL